VSVAVILVLKKLHEKGLFFKWKKQFLENASELFSSGAGSSAK